MRVIERVQCDGFPCPDVRHDLAWMPGLEDDPSNVVVILVSEAAALDPADGYEAPGDPLFARTTVEAFRDAGFPVSSINDVRRLGVHLTTAVKCAKSGYAIAPATIRACSVLLEHEIELFPRARALLLMGEVAIRAINEVARRSGEPRVVPGGATYRARHGEHRFRDVRVFPSYLQAGPAFYIEKQKRRMIAEDIAAAMCHAGIQPPSGPAGQGNPD